MKLDLAFAFYVAATCLRANITSASNSDTVVADNEAPAASHLRPRAIGPKVDQVRKADKTIMQRSEHENMISKTSHLARRDTDVDSWTQQGEFIGEAGDRLGWGIALAKQGKRFAIGSPGGDGTGKVQVFEWDPLMSSHVQVGSDIVVADKSPYSVGYSVAMSEDGTHLIAGGGSFVAMFEYDEDENDWVPLGINSIIDIPGASNSGTVDMTKDGKRIAFSNPWFNNLVGKVMIYDYVCDGLCSWKEVAVLNGFFPSETFGSSLSMSDTGATIVIGSSHQLSSTSQDFVRVFEESDLGWAQVGLNLNVDSLASNMGGVSMDGSGKRFSVLSLLNNEGLRVYDITESGNLELDGAMLECYSNYATAATKLSEDGDRVIVTCNDEIKIYDRNVSSSVWEQVGSIPNSEVGRGLGRAYLSLSRDGMTAGTGDNRYGGTYEDEGMATIWKSPPKCTNSPLRFQAETVGGSVIPFKCKWAETYKDIFTCSDEGKVATQCPELCGTCSEYGCSDSEGVFIRKGKERDCSWLQKMDSDRRNKKCKNTSIAMTCRQTCEYCE